MSELILKLLGGFEARTVGEATLSFPTKKTKALLAYLAAHPGKSHSRSDLANLLWGGSGDEQARASLRQTLSYLRKALTPTGQEHLVVQDDLVSIDPATLQVDVATLENLTAQGIPETLERAGDLYRGDFLKGFDLREEEFNDWLGVERARLRELATEGLKELLTHHMGSDQLASGLRVANQLLAIDPLQEQVHRTLMRLYLRRGERALALKQYETCRQVLLREVGVEPDDETKRVSKEACAATPSYGMGPQELKNIPEPVSVNRVPIDHEASGTITLAKRPRRKPRRWAAAASVVAALVGAGAVTVWLQPRPPDVEPASVERMAFPLPDKPSIAVLPFESLSGDPERSFFADGLTNDIITDLSKFSTLFVIASESSFRYRGGRVTVKEVGRDLGVRYVLKGSVQSLEGRLLIDVNLIEAKTGRHIWAEHFERRAENLFAVQKEITRTIAAVVGSDRGELQHAETERIRRIPTNDLQAYGLYVRGVEYKRQETREGNALAREMFEKAIQEDPNYARAMADYSLVYLYDIFQGWTDLPEKWLQRAEELARRAIRIDSSEPWGFVALGAFYQTKARNEEAISLFETAYGLNPNDYWVNQALGYALTYAGSAERGVKLLERARRLNPYHTEEPTILVWAYFFAHRYQDALTTINKITRRQTQTHWIYKAAIHSQLDQMKEARAAIAEVLKLDPELTVQSQHERRLALGLAPKNAAHLSDALRKAGLPN